MPIAPKQPADQKRLATRRKVSDFRQRQREKGLRLVQIWVPDTRTPEFLEEARRQSRAVATAADRAEQDFIDSISEIWEK
jgi:hypothetical protein